MKKKILALVLTLSMVLSLVPVTALAADGNEEGTPSAGSTIYVDAMNGNDAQEGVGTTAEKAYQSLEKAVTAAASGDTIQLSEGKYSTYGNASPKKSLTFVGAESGKTEWYIGSPTPDQHLEGTEYNGDYSFDSCENITFQKIKFNVYPSTYKGFIRINNVELDECEINGMSTYWGYKTTTFRKTVFNCPSDYALWYYTGHEMTFDGCTFNSKGKIVNAYREAMEKTPLVLNFKDCTVENTGSAFLSKQVLNIKDDNNDYIVNISGTNTVTGVKPNGTTCSRWFQVKSVGEGKLHYATVNIDGETVWKEGKMVSHAIDTAHDKYTDGYKDNAFTTIESDWTFNSQDGKMHRTVTKKCNYCGDEEVTQETKEPTPVEPDDPNAPVWQTSKSKKATKLNGNYESKVTLSLPSAEENLATDVVLAMDVSWYTDKTLTAVKGLLNDLSKVQQETGANIKIGISMFKGCAVPFQKLVTLTPEKNDELQALFQGFLDEAAKCEKDTDKAEAVKDAVRDYLKEHFTSNYLNTGTNMPAGLLLAKQMLDQDTEVKADRKYMVLVSDGSTYLFTHGQDYTTAWSRHYAGTREDQRGGLYENNWRCTDFLMSNEASSADWTNWLESVAKLNESFTEYDYIWKGVDTTCPNPIPLDTQKYLINGDTSIYQATAFYKEMQKTGYNCYYCYIYDSEDSYGRNALKSLNDDAHLVDAKTTSTTNIFSGITKDIIYLLGTGSTVKDEIGSGKDNKGNDYNFDFVDKAEAMTLTVGKTTYVTKKVEATAENETSRYLFVKEDVETANPEEAPYVLHYYQKGEDGKSNECFVWNINVPVSNFAPVALTYSVKLVNPNSASGTYGQYDVDGSKNYSGLYTNNSATLYPKDSNNNWGIPENFLKPTVSYTVSGGSGGNHKPTVTIPDDVPTGLNGKDHYAYVVGYPDGMVYPQKNITRAEVATIFFRLLKDETREANMTKSNGYNDMKDGAWYTCAVSTLSKMGIIKGYEDGSFKPDASISRAEFAAIAARFDPDGDKTPATFSDVSSHWAKDEISIAANHGWIKGYEDGSFKPDQKITRAETMTLVNRVLKRLPETKDDLHKDMKTWPDNQNESAWFYLAVQEATNSHYQKLKKDGTHEKWESMRETRDWAALEK